MSCWELRSCSLLFWLAFMGYCMELWVQNIQYMTTGRQTKRSGVKKARNWQRQGGWELIDRAREKRWRKLNGAGRESENRDNSGTSVFIWIRSQITRHSVDPTQHLTSPDPSGPRRETDHITPAVYLRCCSSTPQCLLNTLSQAVIYYITANNINAIVCGVISYHAPAAWLMLLFQNTIG